jgi:hypothetical protein
MGYVPVTGISWKVGNQELISLPSGERLRWLTSVLLHSIRAITACAILLLVST